VETEKTIVRNALLRLFNPTMTSALLEGFYAANPGACQFLSAEGNPSVPPSDDGSFSQSSSPMVAPKIESVQEKPAFALVVADFPDTYFAKDYFPKFTVAVAGTSGQQFFPPELAEFQVAVSVHNKWADVTSEVLATNTTLIRTVKDGVLDISDLIFIDVSLKHGGFFTLHVSPLEKPFVSEYISPSFAIQSVKTHCNRKRKTREQSAPVPVMTPLKSAPASNSSFPQPSFRMDGFVVNDAKLFLLPQTTLAMDAMDYGLSGGFFDMDADVVF